MRIKRIKLLLNESNKVLENLERTKQLDPRFVENLLLLNEDIEDELNE